MTAIYSLQIHTSFRLIKL